MDARSAATLVRRGSQQRRAGSVAELRAHAKSIRRRILTMATGKGRGYVGQGLGAADILTALYCHEMAFNPNAPTALEADRFLLSVGHYAIGLYAALAEVGILTEAELETYSSDGSYLQPTTIERPDRGIEITGGSLGQGLPVAAGLALAGQLDGLKRRVFVLLSDGELQEGATWEAAMFATHRRLDRLIALVDVNRVQADGDLGGILEVEPVADKWRAFGWDVQEVDGNDLMAVVSALRQTRQADGRPRCIVCHTTLGFGVRLIMGREQAHFVRVDDDEWALAFEQLEAQP